MAVRRAFLCLAGFCYWYQTTVKGSEVIHGHDEMEDGESWSSEGS